MNLKHKSIRLKAKFIMMISNQSTYLLLSDSIYDATKIVKKVKNYWNCNGTARPGPTWLPDAQSTWPRPGEPGCDLRRLGREAETLGDLCREAKTLEDLGERPRP